MFRNDKEKTEIMEDIINGIGNQNFIEILIRFLQGTLPDPLRETRKGLGLLHSETTSGKTYRRRFSGSKERRLKND